VGTIQVRATVGSVSNNLNLQTPFTVLGVTPAEEIVPFPSPYNPHRGTLKLQFRLEAAKDITVKILDQFGQQVWETSLAGQATVQAITWDGKTKMGDYVATGVYYAVLEVSGTVKSKKKFGVKK
jgi:hypothetical protein